MNRYLDHLNQTVDELAINELFGAVAVTEEGGRVANGLRALANSRGSNAVRTAIVRTSPTTVVLVAATEGGQPGSRSAELQIPLTANGRNGWNSPTIFVKGDDDKLHSYGPCTTLATWTIRQVACHLGEAESHRRGDGASTETAWRLPGGNLLFEGLGLRLMSRLLRRPGNLLFEGLGLHFLEQQITQATQPRQRFAPAPTTEPLLLNRDEVWSPDEYTVPAGWTVEDIRDVPVGKAFTAVWVSGDPLRGVSPTLLRHKGEIHRLIEYSDGNCGLMSWDDVTSVSYADRFVLHETAPRHKIDGPGYTGPLPGEPHRRLRWDYDDTAVTIIVTTLIDDEWVNGPSVRIDDTDDADTDQVIDKLLETAGLCWADIEDDPQETKLLRAIETS